jgi:hypothetical protein
MFRNNPQSPSSGAEQKGTKTQPHIAEDYIFPKFRIVENYTLCILQFKLSTFIVDSFALVTDGKNINRDGPMRVNFIHKVLVLISGSVIYFSSVLS